LCQPAERSARLAGAVAADAGPDLAEDVTHDSFLRAYRNDDEYRVIFGNLKAETVSGEQLKELEAK